MTNTRAHAINRSSHEVELKSLVQEEDLQGYKNSLQSEYLTQRLLVLGDAGSGKTTTLRYAVLQFARSYRQSDVTMLRLPESGIQVYLTAVCLPIYVRLTLFAATLPADIDALEPSERQRYLGAPPELFLLWLDNEATKVASAPPGTLSSHITAADRRVILFLDGLDEAGDVVRRSYIAQMINNLANRYPQQRYVIASRTAGYGGQVHLEGFTETYLSPLNEKEATLLLEKWYGAVHSRMLALGKSSQQLNVDARATDLWDVIQRNERLREMASNPLLLTAMALLQFNNVRLPDQRAKLYEKLVELLLDLWRKQQLASDTLRGSLSVSQLATEQRRIEALALRMQQQPKQAREVTLSQAQEWLSPLYIQRLKIDREEADRRVHDLLYSLTVDSGLIQRREDGYTFSHYTFQEYLAARALDGLETIQPNEGDAVQFLLKRSTDSRWRETLLLAVGHWSNGQQLHKAEQLLQNLLRQRTIPATLLVGAALVDIGEVEEFTALRDEAVGALRHTAFSHTDEGKLDERNSAAIILDQLNEDNRPELDLRNVAYWGTTVKAGRVECAVGDQARVLNIAEPFVVARYPVTNRQYAQFLDSLSRQGRDDERTARQPKRWPGAKPRAGEGNVALTGIRLEDALAFSEWVSTLLGTSIRLPTADELMAIWHQTDVAQHFRLSTSNIENTSSEAYTTVLTQLMSVIEPAVIGTRRPQVLGVAFHRPEKDQATFASGLYYWCSSVADSPFAASSDTLPLLASNIASPMAEMLRGAISNTAQVTL